VVLRLAAVACHGAQVALHSGAEFGILVTLIRGALHLVEPVLGVQAGLDALGQGDLLLSVEQGDLADLLQVGADRVSRRGQLRILAGLAQGSGLLDIPDGRRAGIVVLVVTAARRGLFGTVLLAEFRNDVLGVVFLGLILDDSVDDLFIVEIVLEFIIADLVVVETVAHVVVEIIAVDAGVENVVFEVVVIVQLVGFHRRLRLGRSRLAHRLLGGGLAHRLPGGLFRRLLDSLLGGLLRRFS